MLKLSHLLFVKRTAYSFKVACIALALSISNATFATKTEAQAAEEAKTKHGGKVVEVKKLDDKFKVKLLQEDGRVILVTITM